MLGGWVAAAAFGVTLPLLDIAIGRSLGDMTVRWLVLSAIAVVVTVLFTRRTMRQVGQSLAGERVARAEAEALAELVVSIASGNGIQDTLSTAAAATARLFAGRVRCSILLPSEDGLLRLAAWSHEDSRRIAGFAFSPGQGFNGTAFTESRLIQATAEVLADIGSDQVQGYYVSPPLRGEALTKWAHARCASTSYRTASRRSIPRMAMLGGRSALVPTGPVASRTRW